MTTPTIPETQKAAVVDKLEPGSKVEIREIPVPQVSSLKPGECLIKLECSGVCHSDLGIKSFHYPACAFAKLPLVGGHEGVGRIVAFPENSPTTNFSLGQRVGIKWLASTCLTCDACTRGSEWSCPSVKVSGLTLPGTFQHYLIGHLNGIVPIPDGVSNEEAAPILCAGVTVYHAVFKESNTRPGDWIALPGAGGGLGHLAIQYAKAAGLRVVAIDTGEDKEALCKSLGAERWIDFRKTPDLVKAVVEATDGQGPNAAIVAAASVVPYQQALGYLAKGGTLVAVGLPPSGKLEVDVTVLVGRTHRIQGSYVGNRQDTIEALQLVAEGKVKPHVQVRKLEDLPMVYEEMEAGTLTGRVALSLV